MNEIKEFNRLKRSVALKAIGKIVIFTLITAIIVIILGDWIYNDSIADFLSGTNMDFYRFCVENKVWIIIGITILIFLLTCYFVIRDTMNNIIEIIQAMNHILKEPEKEIKLNPNLILLENKLNKIRIDLITNQNMAKEAEQKKNDLIVYMAHDLKTPLTSIIGYLTLLTEEKEISSTLQDKYQKIVLKKAYRVEELINQFFDITKYNLQKMPIIKEKLDLGILLEQLVEECYPMLKEKELTCKVIKPEKIEFEGDGDKLARAFENLMKNAILYSYVHTQIKVEVKDKETKWEITFKNRGDKIPEYKLDKIFEKFYRVDEARASSTGGAGLGLAITKQIIELHGGRIYVCQKEAIEFHIELPKGVS